MIRALSPLVTLAFLISPALAGGCTPVAELKKTSGALTWKATTNNQQAFLAGVFAMNPITHPGLPLGDKAFVLKSNDEKKGYLIIWTDLDQKVSCDMMAIPQKLMDLMDKIRSGGGDDL